ncbi:MAG: hypothetical protein FJ150_10395 [Euryarchaeota archaeon]|nr:hypothetical protein [Euryarchaeota archaeon]
MKKIIVTTTINPPTEALIKYSKKENWSLIVIGDLKTPHDAYKKVDCIYFSPEEQEKKYPELSEVIGWKTIQRRNIGFVEAYNMGADVIATVDDDNIPYEEWGKNVLVGQKVTVDLYEPEYHIFDPLSVTNVNEVWHRGYPIENVPYRNRVQYKGKTEREVLVQADLWDGDPDIDAIARLSVRPIVKFDVQGPYAGTKMGAFNSQNTFISGKYIRDYLLFPFIGRMDDIWASYYFQHLYPDSVVYNKASVYQERNAQDLVKNLENEVIGYRNTLNFVNDLDNFENYLPDQTKKFIEVYKKQFN